MGMLGLLTGWDQYNAAGNAILANHILPYLDGDKRHDIAIYIINGFKSTRYYSTEELLDRVSTESRATQLNLIATACAGLQISPKVNDGIGWRLMKRPHVAGWHVKPVDIELSVKWLKKKTGVDVDWSGDDARIDFHEWYYGQVSAPYREQNSETKAPRGEDVAATVRHIGGCGGVRPVRRGCTADWASVSGENPRWGQGRRHTQVARDGVTQPARRQSR